MAKSKAAVVERCWNHYRKALNHLKSICIKWTVKVLQIVWCIELNEQYCKKKLHFGTKQSKA